MPRPHHPPPGDPTPVFHRPRYVAAGLGSGCPELGVVSMSPNSVEDPAGELTSATAARDQLHPEIRRAMDALHHPEVQVMLERLARFGLGIAVPHMHNEAGKFLPLPADTVSFEEGVRVSFRDA